MHGLADLKALNDAAARRAVEHKPDEAPCPDTARAAEALDRLAAETDQAYRHAIDRAIAAPAGLPKRPGVGDLPMADPEVERAMSSFCGHGGRNFGGWIRHTPGKVPVRCSAKVDVKFRDGVIASCHRAGNFYWGECGNVTIVAYRPAAKVAPAVTTKAGHGPNLPTDAKARKALPICTGVLDYFPDALAAVAEVSRIGNDQHNPGQPLHWSKGKSTDHADCAIRHFAERGTRDTDGGRHTAKAAWRVLAQLQMEIEAEKAGMSFNAYVAKLNREAA